jgi:hypothetical protein
MEQLSEDIPSPYELVLGDKEEPSISVSSSFIFMSDWVRGEMLLLSQHEDDDACEEEDEKLVSSASVLVSPDGDSVVLDFLFVQLIKWSDVSEFSRETLRKLLGGSFRALAIVQECGCPGWFLIEDDNLKDDEFPPSALISWPKGWGGAMFLSPILGGLSMVNLILWDLRHKAHVYVQFELLIVEEEEQFFAESSIRDSSNSNHGKIPWDRTRLYLFCGRKLGRTFCLQGVAFVVRRTTSMVPYLNELLIVVEEEEQFFFAESIRDSSIILQLANYNHHGKIRYLKVYLSKVRQKKKTVLYLCGRKLGRTFCRRT